MSYIGNDWSFGCKTTNRNPETGIRYGIISDDIMMDTLLDIAEFIYACTCPHCGNELPEGWETDPKTGKDTRNCPACSENIADGYEWSEYPIDRVFDEDGVKGRVSDLGEAWCFESPYYTRACFASPCAPGAVVLSEPHPDGPKAYCFPHDWYDSEVAPYPVYQVSDDTEVVAPPEPSVDQATEWAKHLWKEQRDRTD